MKITLPLLLLVFCVLACGRFGSSPDTTANQTSNTNSNTASATKSATPAPPVKIVDIPSLVGKSRDEVKKIVSAPPTSEHSWIEWSFPQGDLTIQYTKARQSSISFSFKPMATADGTMSALGTAEKVGAMVGIDVKGETLKSTNPSSDTYEQVIQGKKVEVVFRKLGEHFVSVAIDLD